ncbi:MAG: type I DNA topoisomerase [Gammaproteobacteria bacterium]|nr:type I DNA topoisomerase [Gammaproteobacteria bacterium]MBT7522902.1 type I DNA topoisomerase [Gammaproteobacteria bacterium]
MSENLVIVESPAKSKTIEKYLGQNYRVISTVGHLRNLPSKQGIDVDNNYQMNYELIERDHNKPQQIIRDIKKALKNAKKLYLATDQDREGEVIAWHLIDILEKEKALAGIEVVRIVFNEITKKAILQSIENPRELSYNLINAQFARRSIDYLFGMGISPLLWGIGIRKGSAGRVQSPALKMIVEREEAIRKFIPQEYWTLNANLLKDNKPFEAFLHNSNSKRLAKFDIENEKDALRIKNEILEESDKGFKVLKVVKKERKRQPAKPFITSTLQQEASRKLRYAARRTMGIAQELYTGIDIGEGAAGLITYMRTDSINLAQEAIEEIRKIIPKLYGDESLPSEVRKYSNTSKNAQEAHEAIRPTSLERKPEDVKKYLSKDQFDLYSLIWKRTVASQMNDAILDSVSIDLGTSENFFRATGQSIKHPGFMQVYLEGSDEEDLEAESKILPIMQEGDIVQLEKLDAVQHFTQPPGRYTEASLIKNLEKEGIGRPSTYAAIIETLRYKEYVEVENRTLTPTGKGSSACAFLDKNFNNFIKYNYTAELEETLDKIARGEVEWVPTTDSFYKDLTQMVGETEKLSPEERKQERILGLDPKSGRTVSVRHGPFGPHAMIGTKDDPKEAGKPKSASLKIGQDIGTITLEDAMDLFVLPRLLGETPDGEHITACLGRFGPYLNYGEKKNLSLKGLEEKGDNPFDPYTITFEQALPLVEQKKIIEANKVIQDFEEKGIQVLNGRFGPYVTDGNKNVKVPKDQDPKDLSLAECEEMIENAPAKRGRFGAKKKVVKKKVVKKKVVKKKVVKKKAVVKKKKPKIEVTESPL